MSEERVAREATTIEAAASAGIVASVVRNVSAMIAGQVVSFALAFALRVALGRYLGDVGFGKLTFALSIGAIFSTVGGLGLSPLVAKEAARALHLGGRYLANGMALRLLVGLPLYGGFCLIVTLLKSDSETRTLAYLVGLAFLVDLLVSMTGALFQAHEKMVYISLGLIVEKLLTTGLSIWALSIGYGVVAVGWVMVAAAAVNLVASLWFLTRLGPLRFSVDPGMLRSLLVAGAPFFVWAVFATIYFRIDATMLSLMTNDAVTGWYGVSYTLYETLGFLPAMLKTVLLPILSRLFASDRTGFRVTFSQAFYAYSLITPPIAFGTFALARPIVGLIYPLDQFANAVGVLQILSLGFIPLFYNILLATVVVAADKQRFWSLTAVACAVLNPALNLFLIPHFQSTMGNGGVGAAWATNLIEMFLLFAGLALVPRGLLGQREWSVAARTMLAGSIMAGIVWSQRTASLPEGVALGAASYVGCCLLLGVGRIRDVRDALDVIRGARTRQERPEMLAGG